MCVLPAYDRVFIFPRWTAGLWGCCCTPWSTGPCHSMGETTRTSFARLATASTRSPPSPQVQPQPLPLCFCHERKTISRTVNVEHHLSETETIAPGFSVCKLYTTLSMSIPEYSRKSLRCSSTNC